VLYNEVHNKFLTKLWAFENEDSPISIQLSNIQTPELHGSVIPTSKTEWWRQVLGVCPQKFTNKKNSNQKKHTSEHPLPDLRPDLES
jgi:hypothetical protein